jgi:sortase (surface protein transpeptidase)
MISSKCKHVIVIVHLTIQIVKYVRNWNKQRREQRQREEQNEEQKEREKKIDKKNEEQKESAQVEQVPSGIKSQLSLFNYIAIKCKFLCCQSYG